MQRNKFSLYPQFHGQLYNWPPHVLGRLVILRVLRRIAFTSSLFRGVSAHLEFLLLSHPPLVAQIVLSGRWAAKMDSKFDVHAWHEQKLRDWLLLLLRFAITREASDQSAVLSMANELDSLGGRALDRQVHETDRGKGPP